MRAAVVRGSGVEVTTLSDPVIFEGEVLIEMRVCGVCGTDLFKLRNATVSDGTVLGHEVAGVVRESRTEHLSPGDRVFVPHHVPCGECKLCRRGNPPMCPEFKINCMDPGGLSELIRVLAPSASRGVRVLPDGMTLSAGALIEPLACCLRSVRRSGMKPGDTVLVVGAGQVGTYHIMTAAALEAGRIIACDIDGGRLEAARAAGANDTVDASAGDPVRSVLEILPDGVDAAFVTSESPAAASTAIETIREGGTVVLFAHGEAEIGFDPNRFLKGERTITASYSSSPEDHEAVMQMISDGRFDPGRLETLDFTLAEAARAVEAARSGQALRVVVTSGEDS
jgi:L-iditol 2-dehydrogenase